MYFLFRYSDSNRSIRSALLKMNRVLLLIVIAAFPACSDLEKSEITALMDARDLAMSQRNISDYSALIYSNYDDQGRSKVDIVAQMVALFDKFDRAEMRSYNRQIQQLNDEHARCNQSYTLKVLADGEWRKIVQREQLALTRDRDGWKISGGL
ncbi:MAG: hypothetical protein K9M17_00520 [Mariprofundaceae bacterium]|nr:hypothetical protein [Mariprofundaceae bacterium]